MRMMLMFVVPMFLAACGVSTSSPEVVIVETPKPVPAKVEQPVTVALVAQADKTRQEVTSAALVGNPPNEYLIRVIGLTHKLDDAVAVLKDSDTKANRMAVRNAIKDLHRLVK